jgi:type IV pilus assembly protein PilQ
VTTQVLVNNGQTVVLGGIYETENLEAVTKVPLLGDIPLLGYLFRRTQTVSNKAELLIFITPKILQDGAAIY